MCERYALDASDACGVVGERRAAMIYIQLESSNVAIL